MRRQTAGSIPRQPHADPASRGGATDRLAEPVRRPAKRNGPMTESLSVVVERELPYPPEKIWRALTEPDLLAEWLMQNDFEPAVGHRFTFRGDWGAVDCRVLQV